MKRIFAVKRWLPQQVVNELSSFYSASNFFWTFCDSCYNIPLKCAFPHMFEILQTNLSLIWSFVHSVNRIQKEEALKFRVTKSDEVSQAEKVKFPATTASANRNQCLTENEMFSRCEASCSLYWCLYDSIPPYIVFIYIDYFAKMLFVFWHGHAIVICFCFEGCYCGMHYFLSWYDSQICVFLYLIVYPLS